MSQPHFDLPPNGLWLPREVRRDIRRDRRLARIIQVDTWITWTWNRLTRRAQSLFHRSKE